MALRPPFFASLILVLLLTTTFSGCLLFDRSAYGRQAEPGAGRMAYHALYNETERVRPLATEPGEPILPLPDHLLIDPGVYAFEGATYALQQEGVYRFLVPGEATAQRIVWAGDQAALMSSIAWIYTHGKRDDGKEPETVTEAAMERKIEATCGAISSWIVATIGAFDIPVRMVTTLTLDEWNDYNNGHTMVEVWDETQGWIVYDLDNNAYFVHDGEPLSFLDFVQAVPEGDYEVVRVARDIRLSVPFEGGNGFDYTFYSEYRNSGTDKLRQWYERVIQVPLIEQDERYWFFDAENRERVESYSRHYAYMPQDEWMATFYPERPEAADSG